MLARATMSKWLEPSTEYDKRYLWVDIALILLIGLNIIALILQSIESLDQAYHRYFWYFEIFSITVFTLEYGARIWSIVDAPEYQQQAGSNWQKRWRYIRSPMAIIDLLAFLPFYLGLFIDLDLRYLRVFRLLRVFKLTRYSRSMQLLMNVFKEERFSLFAAFAVLFIIMLVAACAMYSLEKDIQPEHFSSIPQAMWWALVTLTTVGYGDVTPVTDLGKLFGGLITIVGIGMVALPAGILASGFSEQLSRRRQFYQLALDQAYQEGKLVPGAEPMLDKLRCELGVSHTEARIMQQLMEKRYQAMHVTDQDS
ncbi:ion transporter [Alkalimonas delamerensis]|uniref:Ion transporter n=1 Tax=Alkalimonas delamerensis TaxID=265981 RepID=A0ABT9GLU8_9GAMM|nr:ion transporter [Alkalimonas delamerensis]MDP4527904.1 ion transporter [Alkalimonas delamerensis]